MKKAKKLIASLTATSAALMLLTSPTLAATVYEHGGVWNYGVGKKYVWSYYSHNRLTHKSSVQGKYFSSSGWVSPGTQARASAEKAWTGNQSYFDVE